MLAAISYDGVARGARLALLSKGDGLAKIDIPTVFPNGGSGSGGCGGR